MAFENRPTDYALTPEGTLAHKRWLAPDGTRKEGIELEKEQLRVELEIIAAKLLELAKR